MQDVLVIPDAHSCDAAPARDGWIAAALAMPDVDEQHLTKLARHAFEPRPHSGYRRWRDAMIGLPRRVVLVDARSGSAEPVILDEAERIDGPVVAGGDAPVIAWTRREGDRWRVMLWREGEVRAVHTDREPLSRPAVMAPGERVLTACAVGGGGVHVWDERGRQVRSVEGYAGRLAAAPDGRAWLIVERLAGNRSALFAVDLVGGEEIALPAPDDLNMAPEVTVDPAGEFVYVVWESANSLGYNELVGAHRELNLWRMPIAGGDFEPAPGTCRGRLVTPREAFTDGGRFGHANSLTPVRPRVLFVGGEPAITYRRFRFVGLKCYGWDTWLMRSAAGQWDEPQRISPRTGHPDSRYAVVAEGDELLVFAPCCDQRPIRSFMEEAAGERGLPHTDAARNHRVEIVRLGAGETLPTPTFPPTKVAPYIVLPSMPALAPEPPPLPGAPEGMMPVFGDLHTHSAYSKCMSANDGLPEDVLRFQRDTLGCTTLTLTEHVEYMTAPEFAHVLDTVEREAADGRIPLYAVEWAQSPAHHTNFFAIEREVFDHLRAILLANHDLREIYPIVRAELPENSVVAIRHFHGVTADEFGCSGERVTETHDGAIEWAMEAMQTRGNMMLEDYRGLPRFPSNFLNAGARIGLVGGSDHSRGKGPNRFCLTGFWVPEVTPQAIFDAIRERRTVAMSNGKVALWATLEGRPMGSELSLSGPVRVHATMATGYHLRRACLLRDGEPLEWIDLDGRVAAVELTDEAPPPGAHWYCVTVEADSSTGEPPVIAHASPFFVTITG